MSMPDEQRAEGPELRLIYHGENDRGEPLAWTKLRSNSVLLKIDDSLAVASLRLIVDVPKPLDDGHEKLRMLIRIARDYIGILMREQWEFDFEAAYEESRWADPP